MTSLSSFVVKPEDVKFDSQEVGEEILYLLRRHGVTNVPWIIGAVVFFLLPIISFRFFDFAELPDQVPLDLLPVVATFWYLVTLGYVFESFLNWYFNVNIVTNKRIVDIDFWGILYRRVSELEYASVEDVTYTVQGLSATLFNYGNIYIQTAAETREFEFRAIPNPDLVHDVITNLAQNV